MRTTEPLFLPNQQIFTMRSLHYQLRAVIIDLSCLKVKSDLYLTDVSMFLPGATNSTPDRMICRRKLDYFGIK